MRTLVVTPAELSSYKQYENSDCLNGASSASRTATGSWNPPRHTT